MMVFVSRIVVFNHCSFRAGVHVHFLLTIFFAASILLAELIIICISSVCPYKTYNLYLPSIRYLGLEVHIRQIDCPECSECHELR
jgi:hypothetical protein